MVEHRGEHLATLANVGAISTPRAGTGARGAWPSRAGHAVAVPGSAFNLDGNAGTRYAGEQPQNSKNSRSVSQYDVACTQQPSSG